MRLSYALFAIMLALGALADSKNKENWNKDIAANPLEDDAFSEHESNYYDDSALDDQQGRVLAERRCNTPMERGCFNPIRDDCKRKYGRKGNSYKKCADAGRKECCSWSPYFGLEDGDVFYEEVWAEFDIICQDELAGNVAELESACLEFSNGVAAVGVDYELFTVLDFEFATGCDEQVRRQLQGGKKKTSRMRAAQKGVCNGCDVGPKKRERKKKGPVKNNIPELVRLLNNAGFIRVTRANVLSVVLQDCSRDSVECRQGEACCGVRDCRCDPFELPA